MNLEEIRAYLEQNKDNSEVAQFVQGLNPITVDKVRDFTKNNPDGTQWLQSTKDSHFTTSLETWKSNNLAGLVDAKVKEMYPEETDEQREIKALRLEIEEAKKEATREAVKNKALSIASEKGLPTNLIDVLLRDDEEGTLANLTLLEESFTPYVEAQVEKRFQESGRKVHKGGSGEKLTIGEQMAQKANNQVNTEVKTLWDK